MIVRGLLGSFMLICLIAKITTASEYKRLDFEFSHELLSPKKIYGTWNSTNLNFFHRPIETFTYFLGVSGFSRKEGQALQLTGGVYKDWKDWLYTYSALSCGTNSSYLFRYRLDHEFFFKLGKKKNIAPSIGVSHIKYFSPHKDLITLGGLTYYGDGFNITYKHFINISEPGSIVSQSHMFSLEIGKDKKAFTYLNISFGKQAYLATYLASPEEIRQNSHYIVLKHRHWIGKFWGSIFGLNYLNLKEGYDKYGFSVGIFREF
ncbi:MAG: YaiO family outer membrane beta-barrel protein [Thermodesulfovibrionales bacterium]|nr:YaiO family outer membrane beta-barrel protein [Thermodesulfovibrionales bacterium]